MNRYSSYKDSGVEWIGEIPNHWLISKYKFHIQILSGYPFKSEYFDNENGFPIIRIRDITSGTTETFYNGEFDEEFIVRDGDLLIGMDGDYNLRWWDNGEALLNQRCCSIIEDNTVLRRYLFYVLPFDLKVINDLTYYTTVKHLSNSDIYNSAFIVPPLREQQKIVDYLDNNTENIDILIQQKERKIELLKEKRTALINHVVTKGLEPNVEMKDSGVDWIGEIPIHWNKCKMKHVTKIFGRIGYRGYTTEDIVSEGEGVITISPSNIKKDVFSMENSTYLSWEKYHESPEIQIFTGDIILVKTGSTIGKTAIIPTNVPEMTINPQLVVLKEILINPNYLYYQTTCKYIKESFFIEQTGSTTPTISQEKINDFPILKPPLGEQQAIVNYLDLQTNEIDDLIMLEEKKIDLLKEYRQSLISEVVTGKIRVCEEDHSMMEQTA